MKAVFGKAQFCVLGTSAGSQWTEFDIIL